MSQANFQKDAVHVEVRLRVAWKCIHEAMRLARRHQAQWPELPGELDQTLTAITRHLGRVQITQCDPSREGDAP